MKSSSMQASWIIGTSDQGFYNKDDVGEGGGGGWGEVSMGIQAQHACRHHPEAQSLQAACRACVDASHKTRG